MESNPTMKFITWCEMLQAAAALAGGASAPFNTTTFPPGPDNSVMLSVSGCD